MANPNPTPEPLAPAPGSPFGFVGLTTATSERSTALTSSPPTRACVPTTGQVIELVNLAASVYTENGITLKSPVSVNSFFGQAPAVSSNGSQTTFGPFLSDPRCYYDAQTTALVRDRPRDRRESPDRRFGHAQPPQLIAVSKTSDPTGSYAIFSLDTTNDGTNGTPTESNCPCFGDQPRIGADAHGFYISTDSYPIQGVFNSNGGEIYAISKPQLATAANRFSAAVPVAIHNGAVPIQGEPANAVQPTETPEGGTMPPTGSTFSALLTSTVSPRRVERARIQSCSGPCSTHRPSAAHRPR